jgi:hypothetical protein
MEFDHLDLQPAVCAVRQHTKGRAERPWTSSVKMCSWRYQSDIICYWSRCLKYLKFNEMPQGEAAGRGYHVKSKVYTEVLVSSCTMHSESFSDGDEQSLETAMICLMICQRCVGDLLYNIVG